MIKLTIDEGIQQVDLSPLQKLVAWSPGAKYFNLAPGKEHYKLLASLSMQLPGYQQVVDCGTLYGCSAVALSANERVTVHTFDTEDHLAGPGEAVKLRPNIFCHQQDCVAAVPVMLEGVQPLIIVLDIDPHDGKQEDTFFLALADHQYRGLLICDDIRLNDNMNAFWSAVCAMKWVKAFDVTQYGHWSGTGIVVFDPETIDVEVK